VPIPLDQLPDNADALKRIIAGMAQDATNAQAEIAKLRFQLRVTGGPSLAVRRRSWSARPTNSSWRSRRWKPTDQAERLAATASVIAAAIEAAVESKKPARRPLPDHLPREDRFHAAP